ncbi:MAG TPA: aminoglycoside phosphotransferase family protein [Oscillatoriales cyanobacterium M59_W2019_021]|nr:MAG: aminoglycoside phosphotransferase family protein [Cyanobacteria bacterium J055]HIK30046.1 aminoglycoside phosphotransferase family protein [Oscillatoriales cyanobacterium M4454_W2019_049]HIK50385.1 aminoglycoside phosphotransferase family protein [Oscillatoriales cyanobacterium M59_W2019_021]
MTDKLVAIANTFTPDKNVTRVRPLGNGNINDTFLATTASQPETSFILQRINTQVFRQPQWVMQNIRICTEHMRSRCQSTSSDRRWDVPVVFLTEKGQDHHIDADGSFWRAMSAIKNAESFDTIDDAERAAEVGYALGTFHRLTIDLPPEKLADTLEGFHITPRYLQQYEIVREKTTHPETPDTQYCEKFIGDRALLAPVLEAAKQRGKLPLRLMHGDPKINNVLFDRQTKKAVSLIDLDTVKPGLIHYDIGDCLRSACNPAGEETQNWDEVYFDTDLCRAILHSYLAVTHTFLTENDLAYFYDSIRLITFELGLRFFTDYLAGNIYFKVRYPEHNLARAIVQFKLVESIESRERSIALIFKQFQS